MKIKNNILGINGSASENSSNSSILKTIADLGKTDFNLKIWNDLSELPHFQTELTDQQVPEIVSEFRNEVAKSDGVIICSPEYVFSIPARLKNVLEWCVSTVVFTDKPLGLVIASASGEKALEELKMIMNTIQGVFTEETTLLIQGVKGKVNREGQVIDLDTQENLQKFVQSFINLVEEKHKNSLTN